MNESLLMLKEEFEAAISAYTNKIVDEDSLLVQYVISKSLKTDIINRSGEVIAHEKYRSPRAKILSPGLGRNGRPMKTVVTPLGKFDNITFAAKAHGLTVKQMRGRIAYSRTSGNGDYTMENKK